jgi:hypothetical protein
MKKITLLFLFTIFAFNFGNAQTNLFFDDFESYTDFAITGVGSWTLTDVDGLPTYGFNGVTFPDTGSAKSFQVFNSTTTSPPLTPSATSNWSGYNSIKGMVCFAAVPSGGVVNDDWLISPQITLAASGNTLSFWYKGCDATYSNEMFTVGVSTTGTATTDFTIVSANPESVPSGDITWREYTYDLSTYDGQDIYIGIHCVSNDQFGFMVDDFSVDTSLSVDEFGLENTYHIGCIDKIVTISNIQENVNYKIVSLNGQIVIEGNTQLETLEINASGLASGIYIIEVSDPISNKVVRKKVII